MKRQKHDEPSLYAPRCEDCGHFLVRTESGYLACPLGHGKLIRETPDDPQPEDETAWQFFADGPPDDRKAA
jgi:hypothetical protein